MFLGSPAVFIFAPTTRAVRSMKLLIGALQVPGGGAFPIMAIGTPRMAVMQRIRQPFFAVEARPQAIEAAFCEACGVDFSPSVDNVGADIPAEQLSAFEMRIAGWSKVFRDRGLPSRAGRFLSGLERLRATPERLSAGAVQ